MRFWYRPFACKCGRLALPEKVQLAADGTIVLDSFYLESAPKAENFARQFGITVQLKEQAPAKMAYNLRPPKVALYEPWVANADTGWTQWMLDHFGIACTLIHNDDFQKGDLRKRFDSFILGAQTAQSILHGTRSGEYTSDRANRGEERLLSITVQRPQYTGGIELDGLVCFGKAAIRTALHRSNPYSQPIACDESSR